MRRHHEDLSEDQGRDHRGCEVPDVRLRLRDRVEQYGYRNDQGQAGLRGARALQQGSRRGPPRSSRSQNPLFRPRRRGHPRRCTGLLRQKRHPLRQKRFPRTALRILPRLTRGDGGDAGNAAFVKRQKATHSGQNFYTGWAWI